MSKQAAPAVPELVDDTDDTTIEKVRPVAEPKPPKHNPRTVDMAVALGMSEAEIESVSPDRLRDYVYRESIATANRAREMSIVDARDRDRQANRVPDRPAQPEVFDLTLEGEDDLHPGVVQTLKRLNKENQEYKSKFGELEQREKVRQEQTIIDVIDGAFEALGPDAAQFFGEGGVADIAKGSPEHRRRVAVFSAAGIDASKTPRQIAKLIQKAATELFGPMLNKSVRQVGGTPSGPDFGGYGEATGPAQKSQRPRDEKGRFLTDQELAGRQALQKDVDWATETWLPSHRRGANEPTGVARATQTVAKLLAEQGGDVVRDDSGYGNEDDFPTRGGRDFV